MSPNGSGQVAPNGQLAAIKSMNRKALLALWLRAFGEAPKSRLRREVLIPLLAYRIQEQAFGSLKPSLEKRLREQAGLGPDGKTQGGISGHHPKPGTHFVREWKGKLHEVSVLPSGYVYNDHTYRSLSEIARVITGTRWSGPAFFGLKSQTGKKPA